MTRYRFEGDDVTSTATAAFQQPDRPGRFRPGDKVRFRDGTCTFEVIEQTDTALVRLRGPTGAECKAGWRTLVRVEEGRT